MCNHSIISTEKYLIPDYAPKTNLMNIITNTPNILWPCINCPIIHTSYSNS